jgi:hypothetical protein
MGSSYQGAGYRPLLGACWYTRLMRALAFWRAVTVDRANFLERLLGVLDTYRIRYCVIGGQAVNAYAEPVVSLDLDIAVALDQTEQARAAMGEAFTIEAFPHSLNVSMEGSDLRAQIQTDPRYGGFVDRAVPRTVLGVELPVARLEDVLQGKIWGSKRQKDLADIARLLETYPDLRSHVPADILARLM